MAETIPGGAFLQSDGKTWINANGERIAAPRGDVYNRPEEPEVLTEEEVTPGSSLVDEYGAPEDMVSGEAEDKPRARRSTKKS